MAGIDRLLSSCLSESIKNVLEKDLLKKVERELFLKHGMSIKLSIEHFEKFLSILKTNSLLDAKKIQKEIIVKNIKIKNLDDRHVIKILNNELVNSILGFLGDFESREIILSLLETELTIPDILKKSKVPKTSGYRKIENLILNGVLIETGRIRSDSKRISKYRCCFNEIKTKMNKDKVELVCIVDKKILEKSSSMNGFT
ncbi:transcriptional regulator [Nitrosopumilus sp. K4]|uniref:transcriptional regulator n=1 Tax=Nitrosopumilus sp. K4 TaxID=2795383 RepID=UPI001BA697B2|nr:transcriptional regulator [Nitrosopumilus sp. K4]QUC64744.1 transcriptional regulator [Nitrosopumilus sp. K4]